MSNPLNFEELRKANVERCENYFKHKLNKWSPAEWSNALCGECGETANLTKKLLRGDKIDISEIGKELADVICYADLLAARLEIDLGKAVRDKFNEISKRRNVEIYL